ncbi:MAG: pyruvate kinase, partial [Candidatus Saccharimonadales bacterium]
GTMVDNPEPSRSEVADVSSAVIVGADCLMLSDETATGRYPLGAVEAMRRIILYTEGNLPLKVSFVGNEADHSRQAAICNAVIDLATHVEASAIVAETKSGATALHLAARRSLVPLIAVTSDNRTSQQLAIAFGVRSYVRPVDPLAASKLTGWLYRHKVLDKGDVVVTASGRYPGVVGTTDTVKVRVL